MKKQRKPQASRPEGKIVTFYSYKGGTGRSMALANVAWILASNGKRVLTVDWDLEAPGLHRYFCSFLDDPELENSRGLVDFFAAFMDSSRKENILKKENNSKEKSSQPWYLPYTDLLRFAVAVEQDFDDGGCIDFVPAGRQGPAYGLTVSSFQWAEFYDKLGGGIFLEEVKARLREEYDYILIDSRTGLSDTSGICTVQMPDELVIFFTLNRQSIYGSAAAAKSACNQRQMPTGEPGMKAWPIPTRVDNAEKERLDAARKFAREAHGPLLWHLSRSERSDYWGMAEVPYLPFYAYEEILATLTDLPGQANSLLASMERLTSRISGGKVTLNRPVKIQKRENLSQRLKRETPSRSLETPAKVFLSYSRKDVSTEVMEEVALRLQTDAKMEVHWDQLVPPGARWSDHLQPELADADLALMFVGEGWLASQAAQKEMKVALDSDRRIVPVLLEGNTTWSKVPEELQEIRGTELQLHLKDRKKSIAKLVEISRAAIGNRQLAPAIVDSEDPQKGRWGGASKRNGRVLSAIVKEVSKNWFEVLLTVQSSGGGPLIGEVEFHLHPTFEQEVRKVKILKGQAKLRIWSYGAFTVGVVLDGGRTTLELDLAKVRGVPKRFAEH